MKTYAKFGVGAFVLAGLMLLSVLALVLWAIWTPSGLLQHRLQDTALVMVASSFAFGFLGTFCFEFFDK